MLTWSGETGLATLFLAAFVSATVLPANSEIVLVAVLKSFPEKTLAAIALATLGNTLGSLTTYGLGRLLPQRDVRARSIEWVRRYGAWTLLLAWLPIGGDALCAAAGWLRIKWYWATLAIAVGKLLRYLAVAQALSLF